ncbi:MAG: PDZ domain-containing protein [Bacteroidota bacterium]
MVTFSLDFSLAQSHLVKVQLQFVTSKDAPVLHLPRWRPGRYEYQNFERTLNDLIVKDQTGTPIPLMPVSPHSWQLDAKAGTPIKVSYSFFAKVQDAGGSFVDDRHVYLNGINFSLFTQDTLNQPHKIILKGLPKTYQVACGLPCAEHTLEAASFDEWVDSPLLAGADLQHHKFQVRGIPFHLWFQGNCTPDLPRMEKDFTRYTEAQLEVFGEFPVSEYHYLFVMPPYEMRHGVEHINSTVIAMGPGTRLMQPDFYRSFLEISSHELFHTWNVKALRPADMKPYDYAKAQVSALHYITEGVTTYYGDLMIWKGGGWNLSEWLQSINNETKRFMSMTGKDVTSLEQASIQSWANAYQREVFPNRRISFYTKGYLVAFLLDTHIRKLTSHQSSLDTVMRRMYHEIAKANRGYTSADYQRIAEEECGNSLEEFFYKYIQGVESLVPALESAADFYGFDVRKEPIGTLAVHTFGIVRQADLKIHQLTNVLPGSPAEMSGLAIGDELVAINGMQIGPSLDEALAYHGNGIMEIHFFRQGTLRTTQLVALHQWKLETLVFTLQDLPSETQARNLERWQRIHTEPIYAR